MNPGVTFMKTIELGKLSRSAMLTLLVFAAPAAVFGASLKLEGQSKGCEKWISGNLRNWQDLDYVPCRVRVTGNAANNRTIKIVFPDQNCAKPGFENLLGVSASSNVTITAGPTVSSSTAGFRTLTLKVNYSGKGEGFVHFFARLAAGAHRNSGSSLMLGGWPSSMGKLQIHKPAPSDSPTVLGTNQRIERAMTLPNEGFLIGFASLANRRYGIQYSSDLEVWKTAQLLIAGTGSWTQWIDRGPPETESHPAAQAMRFYRAFLLPDNTGRCKTHDCRGDHDHDRDEDCDHDDDDDRDRDCDHDHDRDCDHDRDDDRDHDGDGDCDRDGDRD
jgi:hypothetical protein